MGGIHMHCYNCYSFIHCSKKGKTCNYVNCPLSCSQTFHACKEEDHIQNICSNAHIPCVNVENGCKAKIQRKNMKAHLYVCPAFLILCKLAHPRKEHRIIDFDRNYSTKEDQKFLNEAFKQKYSKIDLSIEIVDDTTDNYKSNTIHSKHCSFCFIKDCTGETKPFCPIISCPWGCNLKFHSCKSYDHRMICSDYDKSNESNYIYREKKNLMISKNREWDDRFDVKYEFTNIRTKPRNEIQCAEYLRLDQYLYHYQNEHSFSEMTYQVCCWIESKCPFYKNGCTFALKKPYPVDLDMETLILETFRGTLSSSAKHFDNVIGLQSIPDKILSLIFSLLDECSFPDFSINCNHLLDVCKSNLNEHGCVYPQWEQKITDSGSSWSISHHKWYYNNVQPIKRWKIEHLGEIINHLMECPYATRGGKRLSAHK
ncbi:uncharacterized protein [Lepeophtheirus salmonis]|uniref:uncharacterized protein n=1 Tax=Lepeophtheirus salmonis TaxID=72036 RepID=UPI001AEB5274|nr:F-box only protein 40-like [Lepeophtheirus salmonis]